MEPTTEETIKHLEARVRQLEAEQQWISVDIIPPANELILLLRRYDGFCHPHDYSEAVEKGFYSSERNKFYLDDWDDERYKTDDFELDDVTHWRPLPPPPVITTAVDS